MIKSQGYSSDVNEQRNMAYEDVFKNMPEIQELTDKSNIKPSGRDSSIACLVIGIAGQFLWFFPFIGIVIGLLGIVLSLNGIKTNYRKGMSISGLVLSIVCANLSIIYLIIEILIARTKCTNNIYC